MTMSASEPEERDLTLKAFMHPTMKYPDRSNFRINVDAIPIKIKGSKTVRDLMDLFKETFEKVSAGKLELQIAVLWNTKDHKKALHQSDKICTNFSSGDTFGVYGEIMLAYQPLRFEVGTRILCLTGQYKWDSGTIMELNFRDSDWPPGRTVPYLVELDDGDMTIVPQDVNHLCKKLVPPWWVSILANGPLTQVASEAEAQLNEACKGKGIDKCNHKGETALLASVALNWIVGVQALLKMKASVNSIDNKGASALHRASTCEPSILELLLEANANPNLQDIDPDFDPEFTSRSFEDHSEHRTPLHYSCLGGHLELSRLLVQGRADLNIQDGQRKTPLHLAIEEDHDSIVDFLLQSRADVDLCSIESGMKNSPLMDAAHKGKHMLAEKLIAAGADVNRVGKQGMAALHLAARRGDPKMLKILLEARADTTLESKSGTALHLASVASKKSSGELLHLFGVNTEPAAGLMKD